MNKPNNIPVEIALQAVEILICSIPEYGIDGLRLALEDTIETWPEVDWDTVAVALREDGADQVADILIEERDRELVRLRSLGMP